MKATVKLDYCMTCARLERNIIRYFMKIASSNARVETLFNSLSAIPIDHARRIAERCGYLATLQLHYFDDDLISPLYLNL